MINIHTILLSSFSIHIVHPVIDQIPNLNATTGHNVTLKCNATGFGLKYNWTFPSYICYSNSYYYTDSCIRGETEPELTVVNVREHSGTYTCLVTDTANQMASVSTTVTVKGCYILLIIIFLHS